MTRDGNTKGWSWSSIVEHLPSKRKAQNSVSMVQGNIQVKSTQLCSRLCNLRQSLESSVHICDVHNPLNYFFFFLAFGSITNFILILPGFSWPYQQDRWTGGIFLSLPKRTLSRAVWNSTGDFLPGQCFPNCVLWNFCLP